MALGIGEIEYVEKLSDESDMASRSESISLQESLNVHQQNMNRPLNPDFDGHHCTECDVPIPPKRLKAVHTDKCVDCESASERKRRINGKH